MRKFLRELFSLVIIWPAAFCLSNIEKAPRRRTFWQNLVLLPQAYIAVMGKRYAFHLERKYGVFGPDYPDEDFREFYEGYHIYDVTPFLNTGRGVCLHCGRYPCQCEEVDIWRTEDQLKGYEPTDLEKREGLPKHTRLEKREWMITHGLCPDCGCQRDSITGCPKHG